MTLEHQDDVARGGEGARRGDAVARRDQHLPVGDEIRARGQRAVPRHDLGLAVRVLLCSGLGEALGGSVKSQYPLALSVQRDQGREVLVK